MTTQTETLAEFLLARIAEDPDKARDNAWNFMYVVYGDVVNEEIADFADLVEGWLEPAREDTPPAFRRFGPAIDEHDMRRFAAYYADHPDFREEWEL